MHAKSGGSCGEPPDFLFIPAACRSRKEPPRSVGGGDRARNAGYRLRNAEDGGTGTGRRRRGCGATGTERRAAGPRVRGAGRGCGARVRVRNTEDAGVGRRTQNAEHVDADADAGTGTGRGRRETGHRRRGTSPRAWNATRPHTPARPRNNLPGPFTAGRHPPPGPIRRDLSRLDARRRDPQQPAGPFTAGRHPPPGPATTRRGRPQPGAFRRGPHPTCRAYESESRRCRRARRTCCCRAAPRPT